MKYIAHRGYSKAFKDNSLASIHEAVRRGYDGIEIDVQLCKTGEIVLYHDVYIKDAFVCDMTYQALQNMGIISLKDVYDIKGMVDIQVFIDIKGDDPRVIDALEDFFEPTHAPNVYFCSFNRQLLDRLDDTYKKGSTFEAVFTLYEYPVITQGISFVVIHWTCLNAQFIQYCKKRHVEVYTYTHKEPKELEYMRRFDIDGIITNGIF